MARKKTAKRATAKRATAKRTTAKPATAKRAKRAGARRSNRLVCPDCGFVAAHAMGLGRHRSTRHGVVSKRQLMQRSTGTWLSREQAAKRANVHYNTIRQWERSGLVRSRKQGRSVLIDARSLTRATGGAAAAADGAAALEQLETFYAELTAGLKRMMQAAESSRAAVAKQRKSRR